MQSSSDNVSFISTRLSPNIPWKYMGPGSVPVSARDYVALERKRRLQGPFRSTRANATAISCIILSTLLVFVGVLFVALYLTSFVSSDGIWSEWSHWSECSQSCGGGERFRNRSCTIPHPDGRGAPCRGDDVETKACNTGTCDGAPQTGPPPDVEGFRPVSYTPGDLRSVYICENISTSLDVNSGSRACPIVDYLDQQWDKFNATCGQGQTFGTELPGIGGSFLALSGYITSPNHPAAFPDEYGVYHWTIVSTRGSIHFHFTHLDTKKRRPDCKGTSSVAIYCGMDIRPLEPTHGYYCGNKLPRDVTCTAGCAIVRFISIPVGSSHTGFRLEWSDEDR